MEACLYFRPANASDLPRLLEIYERARRFMVKTGNPNQWGNVTPTKEAVKKDIENRQSFVFTDGERIFGVLAFFVGVEPCYLSIYDGEWADSSEYGVIHRIASSGEIKGFFEAALDFCLGFTRHIRIDTHRDNKIMQHLCEKNGFRRCGIIHLANGSERIAYELS